MSSQEIKVKTKAEIEEFYEYVTLLVENGAKCEETGEEIDHMIFVGAHNALSWVLGLKEFPINIADGIRRIKKDIAARISRN